MMEALYILIDNHLCVCYSNIFVLRPALAYAVKAYMNSFWVCPEISHHELHTKCARVGTDTYTEFDHLLYGHSNMSRNIHSLPMKAMELVLMCLHTLTWQAANMRKNMQSVFASDIQHILWAL